MADATRLQPEVEQFLYREAMLLDRRQFDEWLGLFTEDALYWVPNAQDDGDPNEDGIIVYEDRLGLKARTMRLQHPLNPTQTPPPRTQHSITNVIAEPLSPDEVRVCSNQVVYVSVGQGQAVYPGACEHLLRRHNGTWRIARKKVNLIGSDGALAQLPVL
jgi:3-phenylpropionate/cinnamic acid dioxygenase small subunit